MALAWFRVNESIICKCSKSAGVLDKDFNVVVHPSHDADPFLEADVHGESSTL